MRSMLEGESASSDEWILAKRGPKNDVDPTRPYAYTLEKEHGVNGAVEDVATIFITNKECPFRCLMCDLWKNTTDAPVEAGAVPGQIRWALNRLGPARHVKLYNSGNFFDPQAVCPDDYGDIAAIVSDFDTVVVESHPRMVGRRCLEFNEMVSGELQVAMGLETVHPEVLPRLNKHMTLDDFRAAVDVVVSHQMRARAFILLRPPYMTEAEGVTWAKRSLDFAFESGVECCAIIPTRGGNGAMEALAREGNFSAPTLDSLEDVLDYGLSLRGGRVFADLWDIQRLSADAPGGDERVQRLRRINLTQVTEAR